MKCFITLKSFRRGPITPTVIPARLAIESQSLRNSTGLGSMYQLQGGHRRLSQRWYHSTPGIQQSGGQGEQQGGGQKTEGQNAEGKKISSVRNDHATIKANLEQLLSMKETDPKQRLLNDTIAMLAQHDVAEEVVLYPMVKMMDENIFNMVTEQTISIERELYSIDYQYGYNVDRPNFQEDLKKFQETLMSHIQTEENQLLPLLESKLPTSNIDSINTWFERVKVMAPTRPHPDGPHSVAGKLLTGPAVAIVDWLRDVNKKFSQ